jgi:hypothetical protein
MERALDAAGRAYDRVIHLTNNEQNASVFVCLHNEEPKFVLPGELATILNPEERPVLYKIHGSIGRPAP